MAVLALSAAAADARGRASGPRKWSSNAVRSRALPARSRLEFARGSQRESKEVLKASRTNSTHRSDDRSNSRRARQARALHLFRDGPQCVKHTQEMRR